MVRGCPPFLPHVLPTGWLWVHVVEPSWVAFCALLAVRLLGHAVGLSVVPPRVVARSPSPTPSALWSLLMLVPEMAGLWLAMEGVLWWQPVLAGGFHPVGAPIRVGSLATRRLPGLARLCVRTRRARGVLRLHQSRHGSRLAVRGSGRAYSAMAGRTLLLATLFTWPRCGLTLLRTLTALLVVGALGPEQGATQGRTALPHFGRARLPLLCGVAWTSF